MTTNELAMKMQKLAEEMKSLGIEIEYHYGLSDFAKHGKELFNAGVQVEVWSFDVMDV